MKSFSLRPTPLSWQIEIDTSSPRHFNWHPQHSVTDYMSITHAPFPNSITLKNVQILVVDNDRDSRNLYACLLESYGAEVTTIGLIQDALNLLDSFIPTILICEIRFLGESIYPLIQKVKTIATMSDRTIPILATSTYPLAHFIQQFSVNIEAYLLKPIDLAQFVNEIWHLSLLATTASTATASTANSQ